MEELELTIDKVVPGGFGLGFHEGKTVFVPFSAQGDRLRVRLERQQKGVAWGRIKEIVDPGPGRVAPECPVYGRCGGCQLRHLSVAVQEEVKNGFIQDSLQRIGKLTPKEGLADLLRVSEPSGYRRRAGFKVRVVKQGVLLGYFAAGSHRVVDLPECAILDPRLARLVPLLRTVIAALTGKESVVEVACVAGDTGIGVVFHLLRPLSRRDEGRILAFAKENRIDPLCVQPGKKSSLRSLIEGPPLSYQVAGLSLTFQPSDFIQINGAGNRLLVEKVMAACGGETDASGQGGVAWDLFCGVGNFTLPLTDRFETVYGVESLPSALERLRENKRLNGRENLAVIRADLFKPEGVGRLKGMGEADLILLDPPRQGALDVVKKIADAPPKRVVYVSCDPATFSRDAGILVASGGMALRSVNGMDLFPHTHHVEMVGIFDKRNESS